MADVALEAKNDVKPKSVTRILVERIERRTILATMAMSSFIFVICILIFHDVPKDNTNLLYTLLGVLAMLVKDAFSYDFGSTTSSTSKDDTIRQAALAVLPPPDNKG